MERYNSFSSYLRKVFGERVHRITVDAGFTCPTRDGTVGTGGCIYCYEGSSYDPLKKSLTVEEQIEKGMENLRRRYGAGKFIVYFQAYTGTYAPVEVLQSLYEKVRLFRDVVGITVGTRPDCISMDVLRLINSYTEDYMVWIEYGLQSAHFASLRWMKRGHGVSDFVSAVLKTRLFPRINICAHVILAIPVEGIEDMLETADILAALKVDGVKLHPLHVVRGTPLEQLFEKEPFLLPTEEEYARMVVKFLERLPPEVVVQRPTGEAPESLLVAPSWCSYRHKHKVLNLIRRTFEELDTYQGRAYRFGYQSLR